MDFLNKKICKKCVLPEDKPYIYIDEDGVCNICKEYENRESEKENKLLETNFVKLLQKYKKKSKGKYDCLVMCSGGKDSTMSLYYMVKKYKMEPLIFTFNHGFENDKAVENVRKAVDKLGVNWLYLKDNSIQEIFNAILKTSRRVSVCHICALWYMKIVFKLARRFDIPVVVAGWTKGQMLEGEERGKEYIAMSKDSKNFINQYIRKMEKFKDFPRNMEEARGNFFNKFRGIVTSPHWYMRWDPEEMERILRNELGWESVTPSYPKESTNCLFNFVSVYLSMKNYGYTHYHIEMSKLIRKNELTRKEALEKLELNFGKDFVNNILNKINCKIK